MTAVHVVSSHELSYQRLTEILHSDPGILVVDSVRTLESKPLCGSVVFVADAEADLRQLMAHHPDGKFVLVSEGGHSGNRGLLALSLLGVHATVASQDVGNHLLPAVRAVAAGLMCSSAEPTGDAMLLDISAKDSTTNSLTPTEKAVLPLLQRRFRNKEIGKQLRMSRNTVKFHVANIYSKRGIHSRFDLPTTSRREKKEIEG